MGEPKKTKVVNSVEKAFDIIESVNELQVAGVSEIAAEANVPVSTAYIHLNTLNEQNFVIKTGNQYRLSFRFLELGGKLRNYRYEFDTIQREVRELSNITNLVAGFAIEEFGKRVIVYRTRENFWAVGDRLPVGEYTHMHWTSLGKAILAYLPESRVEEIIEEHGLPEGTQYTITDRDDLFGELEDIRDVGYAIDKSERRRGVRGVAVPIFDENEVIVGSIGVSGPRTQFNEDRIAGLVDILIERKNIIEIRSKFHK